MSIPLYHSSIICRHSSPQLLTRYMIASDVTAADNDLFVHHKNRLLHAETKQ
jgi:hypothetical protein